MSNKEYWEAMDYWTKERERLMATLGLYYKDGEWVR
jgi:hypothetical protein